MNSNNPAQTTDEVRQRILDAADQRFRQYGFNKTTMAEIASDCGMSAANIYRYFVNKQDICARLATRCLGDKLACIGGLIAGKETSAAKRLESFVLETLRYTHERFANSPRVNEMVEAIMRERRDIVDNYRAARRGQLAALLAEGNASGEFSVADTAAAAEAILTATLIFDLPLLMNLYPFPELEMRAHGVARLIIDSVRKH